MDLDHALDEQPARNWGGKIAAWSIDPTGALARLEAEILAQRAQGYEPIEEPVFKVVTATWGDDDPVYLAEVRALRLAIPNPMPHVRLFGRCRRRA